MKTFSMLLFLAGLTLAVAGANDDPVAQKKLGDEARARQDFTSAERYYRQAVKADNVDAVVALADVLMRDEASRRTNQNEAAQLYLFALSQGRDDVYFQLARCYDYAWGVRRELIEACKWYSLVADKIPAAKARFDELTNLLPPEQVQEALRRAQAYRKPAAGKAE